MIMSLIKLTLHEREEQVQTTIKGEPKYIIEIDIRKQKQQSNEPNPSNQHIFNLFSSSKIAQTHNQLV